MLVVVLSGSHVGFSKGGGLPNFGCGPTRRGQHYLQRTFANPACMWGMGSSVLHCDKQGAVAAVNSGYSRVQAIMHLLRCLFYVRARFKFYLRAVYIPGEYNVLADAISRDNLDLLFSQVPQAATSRIVLPPQLSVLLVHSRPDRTSPHWTQLFSSCFPPA